MVRPALATATAVRERERSREELPSAAARLEKQLGSGVDSGVQRRVERVRGVGRS
jgi:hypothetical protein